MVVAASGGGRPSPSSIPRLLFLLFLDLLPFLLVLLHSINYFSSPQSVIENPRALRDSPSLSLLTSGSHSQLSVGIKSLRTVKIALVEGDPDHMLVVEARSPAADPTPPIES